MRNKTITLSSGAIRQQLYYFSCNNCKKDRQTVFKKHADNRICRTCRYNKVNENQPELFGGAVGSGDSFVPGAIGSGGQ